jgi:hypothetical protein
MQHDDAVKFNVILNVLYSYRKIMTTSKAFLTCGLHEYLHWPLHVQCMLRDSMIENKMYC